MAPSGASGRAGPASGLCHRAEHQLSARHAGARPVPGHPARIGRCGRRAAGRTRHHRTPRPPRRPVEGSAEYRATARITCPTGHGCGCSPASKPETQTTRSPRPGPPPRHSDCSHGPPTEFRRNSGSTGWQVTAPTLRCPHCTGSPEPSTSGGTHSSPTLTPAEPARGAPKRSNCRSGGSSESSTDYASSTTTGSCCAAESTGTLHDRHHSEAGYHACCVERKPHQPVYS